MIEGVFNNIGGQVPYLMLLRINFFKKISLCLLIDKVLDEEDRGLIIKGFNIFLFFDWFPARRATSITKTDKIACETGTKN
ncbi:hypothetical protein MKW98_011660 [Papaver atlanticum]|uniref:Uncharacterized protein n=1 Tax=Papaver atlanticum TaxID=357466 RepID=A0AAD4XAV2_9MAGN|nr:hypothetical protein MKW98_011660 [Papaver atlanticum]